MEIQPGKQGSSSGALSLERLLSDGVWQGFIHKVFWSREGYIWNGEPQRELTMIVEPMGASVSPLIVSDATTAYAGDKRGLSHSRLVENRQ